jgi:transcriptional regulator with PAS, ATPase and Fis domain
MDTETTLVRINLPTSGKWQATYRLLFDGKMGPVDLPGRPIGSTPAIIGRSTEVEGLALADPRVSRRHLKLWSQSGGREVFFEDSSTNGTFVNGSRGSRGPLQDGDIIRLGDSFVLIRHAPEEVEDDPDVSSLVGSAPSICKLRRTIVMVAPTDATVLIIGESGTGKELVANEIHQRSGRSGPFVAVNCSAIPPSLAESQLFGHVAGSFTGAKEHKGLFRTAHEGTLFLDEIGELPLEVQPKLLRVLEEGSVMPVGGTTPIPIDVRIVVATNRELEVALDEGRFRGDLYARLAEIAIRTPPLRDRPEDVLPLFKLGYADLLPRLSPDLVETMLLYSWPFNVRELFKVAKELRIVARGQMRLSLSQIEHRFARQRQPGVEPAPSPLPSPLPSTTDPDPRAVTKRYNIEYAKNLVPSRDQVESLVKETKGNVSEIARRLGRSRRQVHRYLKMYNLPVEPFREPE